MTYQNITLALMEGMCLEVYMLCKVLLHGYYKWKEKGEVF